VQKTFATFGLLAMCIAPLPLLAQEPATTARAEAAQPAARQAFIPLKVLVTILRYQGDKKISSVPYSIPITIGGQTRVVFNIGASVPYPTTREVDKVSTPSYSYRNVGVNIILSNQLVVEPGLYKLDVDVSDSSLATSAQIQETPAIRGVPIFRNFNAHGTLLLRDGQTTQLATAGDPITGETMRVDVTLSVVK
jgi:Flp pilus assembly secretin CpaC